MCFNKKMGEPEPRSVKATDAKEKQMVVKENKTATAGKEALRQTKGILKKKPKGK